MNIKDYEKLIKIAHDSVKKETEPYKLESYKIILEHLLQSYLEQTSSPLTGTNKPVSSSKPLTQKTTTYTSDLFEELAKSCNLIPATLKDVMTVKDGTIKITASIPGNEKIQRIVGSLCILLANEKILIGDELSGLDILSILKFAGIYDNSGHLASDLEDYRKLFRISGTNKNKVYALSSGNGMNIAQTIIEKLTKDLTEKEIKDLLKPFKRN